MTAVAIAVVDRGDQDVYRGDETGARALSIRVRRDGVAVMAIDLLREGDATRDSVVTPNLVAQLAAAVTRVEEDATIAAAVLMSASPEGFLGGLSPALLTSIKRSTDAEDLARELGHVLAKLERSSKPVVAAIHGPALGAGFELALACHAIVVSDDPSTVLGLPEVKVGLVPAGNGMLRLASRAGLRAALDIALGGESLRVPDAKAHGLIDEVCPPASLVESAARYAKGLVGRLPRVRTEHHDLLTLVLEKNPIGRRYLLNGARERVRLEGRDSFTAKALVLDVLERFVDRGFDAAAALEAKAFGDRVVSETTHRLIELSLATAALERDPGIHEFALPHSVRRIAVVGGGLAGSAIGGGPVASGLAVQMGVRMQVTNDDFSVLQNADAVLEAMPEDLAVKQQMLRQVEAIVDAKCVYGSSTFSIPIAAIAEAAKRPERVLGMRYLNLIPATPLLEVVRADKSDAWAVATAVAIGKAQNKTVIVVKDTPGFFTTRILVPWLNEAMHLLGEGVSVDAIDEALVDWGFAMGPMRALDELGIDAASRVAGELHAAFGVRLNPPRGLGILVAGDRCGKRSRRGIYRYDGADGEGRRKVDPGVYALLGVEARTRLPVEEIQMRCTLALVNEAVRAAADGVLRDPRDGDVGAVFGLGFPRFRGGPFRYVDSIGAGDVLRRVQAYADRFGERWRPAPLLGQMARKGERFFR